MAAVSVVHALALARKGLKMTEEALKQLGLEIREKDDYRWFVRTILLGNPYRVYISPYGRKFFERTTSSMRLHSSRHCVVFIFPHTKTESIIKFLQREVIIPLQRGCENEGIALEAARAAQEERPDLFADVSKATEGSDVCGYDIWIGIHRRVSGRVFYFGVQVKSSHMGAKTAQNKWRRESAARFFSPEEQNRMGRPTELRRTIVVPREGTREERVGITKRLITGEAEQIRKKID